MKNKIHKKVMMKNTEIDIGISSLIQKLWDNNIETIQCCEGGYIENKETRFTYKKDNKIMNNAHIIFYEKDLDKIMKFLPENTDYIIGDKTKVGHLCEWLGSFDGIWANFKLKN